MFLKCLKSVFIALKRCFVKKARMNALLHLTYLGVNDAFISKQLHYSPDSFPRLFLSFDATSSMVILRREKLVAVNTVLHQKLKLLLLAT